MSEDASFDMIRAGRKVRALTVPLYANPRELAGIRTVEDNMKRASHAIKDATEELGKAIAEAERRVTALERERHGESDDLPEFSIDTLRGN